jgi:hypothetical protein
MKTVLNPNVSRYWACLCIALPHTLINGLSEKYDLAGEVYRLKESFSVITENATINSTFRRSLKMSGHSSGSQPIKVVCGCRKTGDYICSGAILRQRLNRRTKLTINNFQHFYGNGRLAQ